jgi:hypothetical protein
MGTDSVTRERYVQIAGYSTGATQTIPPVALNTRWLAGAGYGLQQGVDGANGLSNIGLLVKAFGNVTAVAGDYSYFYISDGSGANDSTGPDGIKVDVSAIASGSRPHPILGDSAIVTGISSMYNQSGNLCRMIRMRSTADLTKL